MNRIQRAEKLISKAQQHFRYSKGCKRAVWHKLAEKQCLREAAELVEAERRERRTVQGRLDGLYQ